MGWVECCFVSASDDRTQVRAEAAGRRSPSSKEAAPKDGAGRRPAAPSRGGGGAPVRSRNIGIGRVNTEESAASATSEVVPAGAAAATAIGDTPVLASDNARGEPRAAAAGSAAEASSPPASVRSSAAGDGGGSDDGLLPFRKQKARESGPLRSRKSIDCMEGYLDGTSPKRAASPDAGGGDAAAAAASAAGAAKAGPAPAGGAAPGSPVTKDSLRLQSAVVRGPDWRWGEEDGGSGRVGTIVAFNSKSQTASVAWEATGRTHDHYRVGRCSDLAVAPPPGESAAALRRMCTAKDLFADPEQTCIIFDWDDTLFPTTYVRDDLRLDWRTPMRSQPLVHREKIDIMRLLAKCSDNACAALRGAAALGRVVLVTLARSPWVKDSCANFFPKVGSLIQELQIQVVYAQDGEQIEYDKAKMMSSEDVERFWSQVKSKSIAAELKRFYSRYEGQSWKNIISIGDSDFERLGTQQAAQEYLKSAGIDNNEGLMRQKTVEVGGRVYKVRTKTFKMLDQPTVEELTVELAMLERWLSPLVKLDGSCDINLNDIEDPKAIQRIEQTLRVR